MHLLNAPAMSVFTFEAKSFHQKGFWQQEARMTSVCRNLFRL